LFLAIADVLRRTGFDLILAHVAKWIKLVMI
jgi:hypothetical protein